MSASKSGFDSFKKISHYDKLVCGVMSLLGSFFQRSNEEGYVQGRLFGLACWLITGILGLVSLYVDNQSKNLFHVYQSWIAFCIIGLIAVR